MFEVFVSGVIDNLFSDCCAFATADVTYLCIET
jgi:hypothetical protein